MSHMAFIAKCQGQRKKAAVAPGVCLLTANARLDLDPSRDAFTVAPVEHPASALLGIPRRTLYRVLYWGQPVGWTTEAKVEEELTRLNHLARTRKKGAV